MEARTARDRVQAKLDVAVEVATLGRVAGENELEAEPGRPRPARGPARWSNISYSASCTAKLALRLIVFGVFGFVEAVFRRVCPPADII